MANVEHVLAANVHAAAERLASCNHLGPHGSFDEYAWCPRCGAVRLKVATIEGDPWQRPALVSALARVLALAQPQPLPDEQLIRNARALDLALERARVLAEHWRAARARARAR